MSVVLAALGSRQKTRLLQAIGERSRPLPVRQHACARLVTSAIGSARSTMKKIVLLRHGESTWNQENRFTGWTDVDLTPKGIEEARAAGRLLKSEGYDF